MYYVLCTVRSICSKSKIDKDNLISLPTGNDGSWFLSCSLGPCSERAGASLPSPRVSKCGASVQCPVSRNYPEEIIPTYARS